MVGKAPLINDCDQKGAVIPTGCIFEEQAAIHKPRIRCLLLHGSEPQN